MKSVFRHWGKSKLISTYALYARKKGEFCLNHSGGRIDHSWIEICAWSNFCILGKVNRMPKVYHVVCWQYIYCKRKLLPLKKKNWTINSQQQQKFMSHKTYCEMSSWVLPDFDQLIYRMHHFPFAEFCYGIIFRNWLKSTHLYCNDDVFGMCLMW